MELKTIKEFAHKNNLGDGLEYSNDKFRVNLNNSQEITYINNQLSIINQTLNKVYKVKGSTSVANINSMTVGNAMIGYVYNMLDSGIITNGIGGEFDVVKGDNIVYTEEGWDEFSVSLDLALRAGKNISIENDAINALGYTYNKEKESFSIGSGSAIGEYSYAEGDNTIASGEASHAEGSYTKAFGDYSHAEGRGSQHHYDNFSFVENSTIISFNNNSFFNIGDIILIVKEGEEEFYTTVNSISENKSDVTVSNSIPFSNDNVSLYVIKNIAFGDYSHVEGYNTVTSGYNSHAEGEETRACERASHSEGLQTIAQGKMSHAEGSFTTASGESSHAEGYISVAQGDSSHAEGDLTKASGTNSHAEGYHTKASGYASHSEGSNTIANNPCEHAQGKYNVSNTGETENTQTIHSIGIGKSVDNRKNAQEVMVNGDYYIVGIGGYNGANINEEGVKTLQEVLNEILEKIS